MMEKLKNANFNISYATAKAKNEDAVMDILKIFNGDLSNFDITKFVIAKDNEKIVGCVRIKVINNNCLELSSLAVLPKYQNHGIGRHLIKNILTAEKHRPIFLLTATDKELYYKKFGAKVINPKKLTSPFKEEYLRVINLPFAKNTKIIAMSIK